MEHLYLQKIGDVYVKSTVDRYLTMNERRQWLHYHQGVLDFERRIGACRDNHLPYDIEQQALEDYGRKRSALGEIVDGPFYGKTKRPEGLLYDALTWYTTLSEQEEVRNQVGALPVNYADLKQQVDALSDLIQSDKMAPVLTSGDMDVLEPIMDLLDSILENMGGSGNALLFDHD